MPTEEYRRMYIKALKECKAAVDEVTPLHLKLMNSVESDVPYYLSEDEFQMMNRVYETYNNFLEVARHQD